jgi:hypothetical protein
MAGRTLIEVVPFAGALGADLFTAHRWSARLILAAIDRRLAAEAADPPRNVTPPARRTPWRPAARPDLEPV